MISWGHPPSPALPLCTALSIVAFFINGDSLRGGQRRKYRFHPAINFQAKPFGQDKVRAGESFQSGDHRCRQGS